MKFSEWIQSVGGRKEAAALLGVTPIAIWYWFDKQTMPSSMIILKVTTLSKGKVTADAIFEELGIKKRFDEEQAQMKAVKARAKAAK